MTTDNDAAIPDKLIPDPKICEAYGITAMTLWRWRRSAKINYPRPLKIGERNYTPSADDRAFRERMVRQAIEDEMAAGLAVRGAP